MDIKHFFFIDTSQARKLSNLKANGERNDILSSDPSNLCRSVEAGE